MSGLSGKTVVVGVTGGIAAYKAAELVRLLVKQGARVFVVMTRAAESFITPLTLQTLSGNRVARNLLDVGEDAEIGHIRLADMADLIVIAPASADAIARLSAGMADDMLTAVVLASRAPVLLAPAMNVNMWENPLVQQNLERLLGTGRFLTTGPDRGALACGWVGAGRLVEPQVIADAAAARLSVTDAQPLAGKRVVVSAGPTREPVDSVRFLGNRSSGRMGFALAEAAAALGAEVVLVAGKVALATPGNVKRRIDVETAIEMQSALQAEVTTADVVVMAAAVADFRVAEPHTGKLSRRRSGEQKLSLMPNPDILAGLARARTGRRPLLVGFAAEMVDGAALHERARHKLQEKGCDVIVANCVARADIGFDARDNQVSLVFADGAVLDLPQADKPRIAAQVWDALLPRLPG